MFRWSLFDMLTKPGVPSIHIQITSRLLLEQAFATKPSQYQLIGIPSGDA
jgi:hypothetical protein